MAISSTDYALVDRETGNLLSPDTTVIVPEIFGALAYDILFDVDAAIEYGDGRGIALDQPGAEGIPVDQLDDEPRGYLAIDLESGEVLPAGNLVVIPWGDDEVDPEDSDAVLQLVSSKAEIPVAPAEVREIEELEYESVGGE